MKRKVGELYNRPIVIGNRNEVTNNEIYLSDLESGKGVDNNIVAYYCNPSLVPAKSIPVHAGEDIEVLDKIVVSFIIPLDEEPLYIQSLGYYNNEDFFRGVYNIELGSESTEDVKKIALQIVNSNGESAINDAIESGHMHCKDRISRGNLRGYDINSFYFQIFVLPDGSHVSANKHLVVEWAKDILSQS